MGFIHLCGVPVASYLHREHKTNKIWEFLQIGLKERHILSSITSDDIQHGAELAKKGLKAGHCYQVLQCFLAEEPGSSSLVKILKLSNPRGEADWNGKWSNDSKAWTPELRNSLQFEKIEIGVFYIEL